ncbi:MAG: undecaprenyldiphospho-muramoylpentapeptide beta-N-acetylglucosaminyltransferase [Gemmatimonadota bacterium]
MSRVVFAGGGTGGHLYPALALAEALRVEAPDVSVHFVGARRGVEARVLPQKGLPFTLLPIEPVSRAHPLRNWRVLPALARSVGAVARLFGSFRPQLVVGTGGYASAPACLWAVVRRIPLALQEQNAWPGATTRLLARRARQVHLGFPEAERHLRIGPATRVFALGNPIRRSDGAPDRAAARERHGLRTGAVAALVVGGSQGSLALNETLIGALEATSAGTLPPLPDTAQLLWATGPSHIEVVRARLAPLGFGPRVVAVPYIDDMESALQAVDLALSRAGAMTTAELLAAGVPALLVPLPTAAADHQTRNAEALAEAGAAVCVPESALTPERLWTELVALIGDGARRERMAASARERARPDAARDIARALLTLLPADARGVS